MKTTSREPLTAYWHVLAMSCDRRSVVSCFGPAKRTPHICIHRPSFGTLSTPAEKASQVPLVPTQEGNALLGVTVVSPSCLATLPHLAKAGTGTASPRAWLVPLRKDLKS